MAAAPPAQAASCPGRFLLQCSEKLGVFPAYVLWTHLGVLDTELFETKTPLHLSNPSLAAFWRFEAASATARGLLDYEFGAELSDPNFEAIAPIVKLPRASVPAHGIVSRGMARVLSRLMAAEQREIECLTALNTAMNRATAARYQRGREDWVRWQLAAAAGFARKTAGSIGPEIRAQRAVASMFTKHKLPFGIGSEDLKLGQRRVRRHGLAPKLVAVMKGLEMNSGEIKIATRTFLKANFGGLSFSLTQQLGAATTGQKERGFAAVLRHFADRIPPASQPPT
jgi:hypothetical protein